MAKNRNTKRALLMSALSLMLCMSMLIGSTFAWFTDSVTSSGNKIVAGSLKVDLIHAHYEDNTGTAVKTSLKENPDHKIFDYSLWEPGYTQVEYFQIINKGNLHFKYEMRLTSESAMTELADVIEVYGGYPTTAYDKDRDVALEDMKYLGTVAEIMEDGGKLFQANTGGMELKEDAPMLAYAIALHMKEDAGNEYQELPLFEGEAGFNVTLLATQMENEFDSFGPNYDAFADYDGEISGVASLVAALENGGTYKVVSDIKLDEYVTVPAGVTVALDLDGKTISVASGNVIRNNGNLTLVDGTLEGATTYTINNESTSGSVSVENVKSVNGGFFNAGTMVVTDSVITNTASGKHALVNSGNENTNLVVNGGTYSTTATNALLYAYSGTIEVNDGNFTQIGSSYMIDGSGITINGGTFTDDDGKWAVRGSNMTINGGTFNFNPTSWIADGYAAIQNADGTYTVEKKIVPEGATLVSEGLYQDADGNYLITNATGLTTMGTMVADEAAYDDDGVWILYADIDMSGVEWTPINGFYGMFDGNEKTISNLTVNTDGVAGLFGENSSMGADALSTKPVIKNFTLSDANVTGNQKVGAVAGAIGYGVIENVNVINAVVSGSKYVGGIAGYAYTNGGITVTNCTVTGSSIASEGTDADGKVGGVSGYVALGTIKNNKVEGCVISGPECVGGILGRGGSGDGTVAVVVGNTISNNTVTGTETATVGDVIGDKLNVKETE